MMLNDIQLVILVIFTFNLCSTFLLSVFKFIIQKKKLDLYDHIISWSGDKNEYRNEKPIKELRTQLIKTGIFLTISSTLISNSILDFLIFSIAIFFELYIFYQIYEKQHPIFYICEKGIGILSIHHPIENEKFGFSKWKNIKFYTVDQNKIYVSSDSNEYCFLLDNDSRLQTLERFYYYLQTNFPEAAV